MSKPKPFRFSLQSFNTESPASWRSLIAKTEDLGYSPFFLADHFMGPGPAIESTFHPPQMLAAIPTIAMALEQTSTLRVGCRVFCNDYRHPIVLAKEAATLDYLSEGRFEFGLGAGWIKAEYDAVNLPFDEFPERFSRFAEFVHAYKAFMGGKPLNIDGDFVRWSGFHGTPSPAQSPWPPLMIGGGSKKILEFAGKEADIVSLNFNNRSGVIGPDGVQLSTAEETARKVGWVREAAGERFASLELEIGEEASKALIPSLLLQPLVENAIKYGIARAEEGGINAWFDSKPGSRGCAVCARRWGGRQRLLPPIGGFGRPDTGQCDPVDSGRRRRRGDSGEGEGGGRHR